jgi:hypothetical protein
MAGSVAAERVEMERTEFVYGSVTMPSPQSMIPTSRSHATKIWSTVRSAWARHRTGEGATT